MHGSSSCGNRKYIFKYQSGASSINLLLKQFVMPFLHTDISF